MIKDLKIDTFCSCISTVKIGNISPLPPASALTPTQAIYPHLQPPSFS